MTKYAQCCRFWTGQQTEAELQVTLSQVSASSSASSYPSLLSVTLLASRVLTPKFPVSCEAPSHHSPCRLRLRPGGHSAARASRQWAWKAPCTTTCWTPLPGWGPSRRASRYVLLPRRIIICAQVLLCCRQHRTCITISTGGENRARHRPIDDLFLFKAVRRLPPAPYSDPTSIPRLLAAPLWPGTVLCHGPRRRGLHGPGHEQVL